MGSGNWLPSRRGELLDFDGYYVDYVGIYGDGYLDGGMIDDGEIDEFINYVIVNMQKRFPDLKEISKNRGEYEDAYLQNGLLKLVIGENETSAAVYIIYEDPQYNGFYEYLDEDEEIDFDAYNDLFYDYLHSLKEILTKGYKGYVYRRNDAWTTVKIG